MAVFRPARNRQNSLISLHHRGCVMLLTDTCGCQDKECASPNASRGGFTVRAGKEACKWSNSGCNTARYSAHARPRASLRMRRGLRSCPPQRVVGSPITVTCPNFRVMRSCAAHRSTPPSVFYLCLLLHIPLGLIPGTQIQSVGDVAANSRRVPPDCSEPRRVLTRAEAVVLCNGWAESLGSTAHFEKPDCTPGATGSFTNRSRRF